jgi:hypothetical protein
VGQPDAPVGLTGLDSLLRVPPAVVGAVMDRVADHVRATVKPAAVAAVAATFSFPLVLMVIVMAFLMIQGRLDAGDPKLRQAPRTAAETTIAFIEEADA